MKTKVAFFCGHQSQYGLAHLLPLLDQFDVKVVVIGTDERWDVFSQQLGGKNIYRSRSKGFLPELKIFAKKIIPEWAIKLFKSDYHKFDTINIKKTLHLKQTALWEIFDVNSEDFINKVQKLDIDLFISAAYPQIFSKQLLESSKRGAVNFHPSLLPKYRGAHPHFWQIVNGEKEGGVTAHFMTEKIDDGDIIAQLSFPIEDCSYLELYQKIIKHTPKLVEEVSRFFKQTTLQAIPQNPTEATYFRNNREIHSRIFWNIHTSLEIYNLIRTGSAFCFFNGKKVVFLSSFVTDSNRNILNNIRVENGTIVDVGKNGLAVKTVDGCINIKEFSTGHKRFSFLQWVRLVNVNIGEKFE